MPLRNGTLRCRKGNFMKRFFVAAVVLAAITGCATYPSDPAQQAQYHVEQVRQQLMKGQSSYALLDVIEAIKRPTGATQLRAALSSDSSLKAKMLEAINSKIDAIASSDAAVSCDQFLAKVSKADIFDEGDTSAMEVRYIATIRKGNETGSIPFTLDRAIAAIGPLNDPQQMQIVFDRTMTVYQDKSFAHRDMQSVVSYVSAAGANSPVATAFKSQLPKLNVRSAELDQVALIDPSFANHRKAQLSMKAHLSVKNADRLFADDVVSRLNQDIRGVTWVSSEQPGALELVVERVRDSEKILPVESRTVTYSYYQVDLLKAALLMPKNASYLFDLKTGGAELDFGYVVSAWKNGVKLQENVLRGKLGGAFRKCENPRIVNVFGGVSSAGFIANSDMESACSGQREVSMDSLRSELLGKISADVVGMPEISEVHSMNL
jgi:hypothetical protein